MSRRLGVVFSRFLLKRIGAIKVLEEFAEFMRTRRPSVETVEITSQKDSGVE